MSTARFRSAAVGAIRTTHSSSTKVTSKTWVKSIVALVGRQPGRASRHAHLPRPHVDADTVLAELEACVHHLDEKPAKAAKAEAGAQGAATPAPSAARATAPKRQRSPLTYSADPKTARRAADPASKPCRPAKGSRIEVFWSGDDAWYSATVGSTRRTDGATCLLYAPHDGFTSVRSRTFYHVLSGERWRAAP